MFSVGVKALRTKRVGEAFVGPTLSAGVFAVKFVFCHYSVNGCASEQTKIDFTLIEVINFQIRPDNPQVAAVLPAKFCDKRAGHGSNQIVVSLSCPRH